MNIEPYDDAKLDAIIRLSLRAWEPVFASIQNAMDPEVFRDHHRDWQSRQITWSEKKQTASINHTLSMAGIARLLQQTCPD